MVTTPLADSTDLPPTTGASAGTTQQSGGSIARRQQLPFGMDTDSLCGIRTAPDVLGNLPDRPHVVKLYGSRLPGGTQIGAFFYGASGT